MEFKNKVLLEYFRELVGSISVNELLENQTLVQRIERTMNLLQMNAA